MHPARLRRKAPLRAMRRDGRSGAPATVQLWRQTLSPPCASSSAAIQSNCQRQAAGSISPCLAPARDGAVSPAAATGRGGASYVPWAITSR